jgi:hypothetical protein
MPKKGQSNYKKLYKIRPLIDYVKILKENYAPTGDQAVDECMVKLRAVLATYSYMPKKLVKRGYKIWVRADKFGYVCDFQVYSGKEGCTVEHNLGERVVLDLCKELG